MADFALVNIVGKLSPSHAVRKLLGERQSNAVSYALIGNTSTYHVIF